MEDRTAKVRIGEDGRVSVEVDISPHASRGVLVESRTADEGPDADVLGRIKGSRGPRWVELAGG